MNDTFSPTPETHIQQEADMALDTTKTPESATPTENPFVPDVGARRVINLKKIAVTAMSSERRADRGWPALCMEHLGLPRVNVLAKLSHHERNLVIAYHRVKIEKELSDIKTGHLSREDLRGLTVAEARKSAKGRLAHIERVVQAFDQIDEEYRFKVA